MIDLKRFTKKIDKITDRVNWSGDGTYEDMYHVYKSAYYDAENIAIDLHMISEKYQKLLGFALTKLKLTENELTELMNKEKT